MTGPLSNLWLGSLRRLAKKQRKQASRMVLSLLALPKTKPVGNKRAGKTSVPMGRAPLARLREPEPLAFVRRRPQSTWPATMAPSAGNALRAARTGRTAQPVTCLEPQARHRRGSWTRGRFRPVDGEHGEARQDLHYWLYWPSNAPATPRPLVVLLHGCGQTATEFAQGTRMNELAERKGFAVLYPQQSVVREASRCWPWYNAANQCGDADAALIRDLVASVLDRYPVNRRRVYVAGISAGAAMAQILALQNPALFAAVGMHSGPVFGTADSAASAFAVMQHGDATRLESALKPVLRAAGVPFEMPALLIHGDEDKVVRPVNLMQVARQFLCVNGLAEDAARPELRDHPARAGGAHPRHGYRTLSYLSDGKPRLVVCQITGLDHAWSGGAGGLRFNSPIGPDASLMLWNFFTRQQRAGGRRRS